MLPSAGQYLLRISLTSSYLLFGSTKFLHEEQHRYMAPIPTGILASLKYNGEDLKIQQVLPGHILVQPVQSFAVQPVQSFAVQPS
jgi:hypothetical protein